MPKRRRATDDLMIDDGFSTEHARALAACRALCRIMEDPEQSMRLPDLARRLKLSEERLQVVMQSQLWLDCIHKATGERCSALISRLMTRLQKEVVENPKAAPDLLLKTMAGLVSTFKALCQASPAQEESQAILDLQQSRQRIREARKLRAPKLTFEVIDACKDKTDGSGRQPTTSGSDAQSAPRKRRAASS